MAGMNVTEERGARENMIDVYADVWCPFTHVGLRRLAEKRAELGAHVILRVHAWPLEIVNGKPMDAAFIGEEVDDLRAQAAPDLFAGFDVDHFPSTTLPALALAEAAYRKDPATGEAFSFALRDALFEQGRDVGDADVLAELAAAHGVGAADDADADAVRASLDEGRARGVIGSPHFFTPTGGFFCPALDIERVDGHLQIRPDLGAFEAFVEACLA